jgi:hypothetical protein
METAASAAQSQRPLWETTSENECIRSTLPDLTAPIARTNATKYINMAENTVFHAPRTVARYTASMTRYLFAVLVLGTPLLAADPVNRSVSLTITSAATPRPAFKHELLPPAPERLAGNAAMGYLRAGLLRPSTALEGVPSVPSAVLDTWATVPIDQMPIEKLRDYLKPHNDALEQLDLAARRRTCDWQLETLDRPQMTFALVAPSLDTCRELSATLRFRTRLELAENRFPAAQRSLQTSLQLAKHLGESRTMLETLVAYNALQRPLSSIEDWIGRPNSPNLYWALASLPQPLIDSRTMFAHEKQSLRGNLGLPDGWDRQPISDADATKLIRSAFASLKTHPVQTRLVADLIEFGESEELLTMLAGLGPSAKRALVASGSPRATIEPMSNAQAVLVRAIHEVDAIVDEHVAAILREPHQAWAEWERLLARSADREKEWRRDPLAALLDRFQGPLFWVVQGSQLRDQRRIQQLRVLEAIRSHVAITGTLPESLAAITTVPVPNDPFTGEPFRYVRTDSGFTLEAVTPKVKLNELQRTSLLGTTYGITVRK